jgi:hypothetical protein
MLQQLFINSILKKYIFGDLLAFFNGRIPINPDYFIIFAPLVSFYQKQNFWISTIYSLQKSY